MRLCIHMYHAYVVMLCTSLILAAQAMAELNRRPIVMPLSNPTSQAECTFAEALMHAGAGLLFASGSPFEPIVSHGVSLSPTQANNACVTPPRLLPTLLAHVRKSLLMVCFRIVISLLG